ncbi:flagellar assembly protein FliW [Paenibacillus sp. NPDC056579]|uniref:flagellar assembly protein FliW n=1 Tax=Paenibacillus sp. NPDC056579 TaxID=3345871 RepID=UPI0036CE35FE
MLELFTGSFFSFQGSILGFEQYDEFEVILVNEGEPFLYLQSTEDLNIGFLVTTPFWLFKEYEFEIPDGNRRELGIQNEEELAVFSIVTIREPFSQSTVNLLAPLIVNIKTKRAKQIVLQASSYNTQTLLFQGTISTEGGE